MLIFKASELQITSGRKTCKNTKNAKKEINDTAD